MENNTKNPLSIPAAIIIAGAIIAIALIYVLKPSKPVVKNTDADQSTGSTINVSPITSADHILGNPKASIKIVEYSDPSCPYCKAFNPTMVDIMNQYGADGKVAWVYRSYPLDTPNADGQVLHPNARNESKALECAATLGGNDKFWDYEKLLYTTTPSVTSATPSGLDQKQLPIMAKSLGLDPVAFAECVSSKDADAKVAAQALSGTNAGVSGTPTSFFVLSDTISSTAADYVANALIQYKIPTDMLYVSDDKKTIAMSGALPKGLITGIIDSLLK